MKNCHPTFILISLIFLLGCTGSEKDLTDPGKAYSTPEAEGISSHGILNFVDALEREQPDAIHSIMLRRHGKIVAEAWWAPFNPDSPHMLYSLSKSFTSTAVGMAQDEGLLSIDDPVISFFPDEAPDDPSDNLKAMRIRDLLKMNSGHQSNTSGRMREGKTWVEGFLSLEVPHKPGTHFVYNSGATYILSAIIQKVTDTTLLDYLNPRLFEPLGIKYPTWESDPEGINVGGWGLSLTTEDISRFGQLYLQKGNWIGEQLVSEDWIEEATSFQTSNGSNPDSDWEHLLPAMNEDALPPDAEGLKLLREKLAALAISSVEGEENSPNASIVSGRTYFVEPNSLSMKSITFNFEASPDIITITNEAGEQSFNVGYGDMEMGTMIIPSMVSREIAVCGVWESPDKYIVKIIYYETPHDMKFTFQFDEDKLLWDTDVNITSAPKRLEQLKGSSI
jgi:hypothetical protein